MRVTIDKQQVRGELITRIRAAAKLNVRQTNELLAYFTPHPGGQKSFFEDPKEERWAFGGNDAGKTYLGAADYLLHLLGAHPFRPWAQAPMQGWGISVDFTNSRDVVQKKIKQLILI